MSSHRSLLCLVAVLAAVLVCASAGQSVYAIVGQYTTELRTIDVEDASISSKIGSFNSTYEMQYGKACIDSQGNVYSVFWTGDANTTVVVGLTPNGDNVWPEPIRIPSLDEAEREGEIELQYHPKRHTLLLWGRKGDVMSLLELSLDDPKQQTVLFTYTIAQPDMMCIGCAATVDYHSDNFWVVVTKQNLVHKVIVVDMQAGEIVKTMDDIFSISTMSYDPIRNRVIGWGSKIGTSWVDTRGVYQIDTDDYSNSYTDFTHEFDMMMPNVAAALDLKARTLTASLGRRNDGDTNYLVTVDVDRVSVLDKPVWNDQNERFDIHALLPMP